ncbi:hypothetical protein P3G55_09665 [Leptospira sp. 96542]|nr:hypothetical protein [Leptospira sp. 96542]
MITIVSHDAGGAEILSNYVLQNKDEYNYILEGPAVSIFEKLLGKLERISLNQISKKTNLILTGTSWQSDIEKVAISIAKQKKIKVVSFLDHWVNYRQRFELNGKLELPDEIWVGDEDAFFLAQEIFPKNIVRLKDNPYFLSLKSFFSFFVAKEKSDEEYRILFICENISDHAKKSFQNERYWGYTETDAIQYFFENLPKLDIKSTKFTFRPHPSDPKDKYQWVIEKYSAYEIKISNELSLFEQIANSDLVVGCESMALVIAMLANKTVVSCIPPSGKKLELPQSKILEMRNL